MYLKQGTTRRVVTGAFETCETLESGNWLLKWDANAGEFFLDSIEDFSLPVKMYGNILEDVDRYLNTFFQRKVNMGVCLNGLRGSGKTLTAKALCINSKLPVIVISQHFKGADFHSFLSKIKQECVVFIDEFEKIFPHDWEEPTLSPQNKLLSLLDGAFESKKLFILTSNDADSISKYLKNRPGRIRYWRDYYGLSQEIINEIIEDTLINKEEVESLTDNIATIGEISYDMIVTIIGEMNMYHCTAKEALNILNIKPEETPFKVTFEEKGIGNAVKEVWEGFTKNHPLAADTFHMHVSNNNGKERYIKFNLSTSSHKTSGNQIIITKENGEVITFTRSDSFKFTF